MALIYLSDILRNELELIVLNFIGLVPESIMPHILDFYNAAKNI